MNYKDNQYNKEIKELNTLTYKSFLSSPTKQVLSLIQTDVPINKLPLSLNKNISLNSPSKNDNSILTSHGCNYNHHKNKNTNEQISIYSHQTIKSARMQIILDSNISYSHTMIQSKHNNKEKKHNELLTNIIKKAKLFYKQASKKSSNELFIDNTFVNQVIFIQNTWRHIKARNMINLSHIIPNKNNMSQITQLNKENIMIIIHVLKTIIMKRVCKILVICNDKKHKYINSYNQIKDNHAQNGIICQEILNMFVTQKSSQRTSFQIKIDSGKDHPNQIIIIHNFGIKQFPRHQSEIKSKTLSKKEDMIYTITTIPLYQITIQPNYI